MIFGGICIALLSTLFGQFFRFEIAGGAILFLDIFLPLLFVLWCIDLLKKKLNPFSVIKSFPLFWQGSAILLIFTLSLLLSAVHLSFISMLESGFYLFRYTFLFLFSIVVWHNLSSHITKRVQLINLSIITATLLAVLGFVQLFIYPDFSKMAEQGWDPHIGRLLSTWFDPNFLGSFFSFMLTIMAGVFSVWYQKDFPQFAIARQYKKESAVFIICTVILLLALLFTFSRSALLAFVLPVCILGIVYFRTLFLGLTACILLLLPFSERAVERITDGVQSAVSITEEQSMFMPDPTARLRVENFETGVELAKENFWTGIGFNTIRMYKTENIHSSGGFDSSLLTVFVTSGIFGLFFFLLFYFYSIQKVFYAFLQNNDIVEKGVALGFLASFLGIFAQSFFINSLFYSLFMVWVFAFLGFVIKK